MVSNAELVPYVVGNLALMPLHNYAIPCIVCLGLDLKEKTRTTMILSVRVLQVILTASSSMLRSLNLSLWLATIGSSESTADLSVLSSV